MLANKLTGEKGILFTAKYVKRFKDGVDIIDLKTYTSAVSVLKRKSGELQLLEKPIWGLPF